MKIVFLTRRFWPALGGVEKHILKLSQELILLGHEVTVITLKHNKKLLNQETYCQIKIIRLPDSDKKLSLWRSLWQERQTILAADIIHCHDVFFWYLPFRFWYLRKPVFITFHGWEGQFPVPLKNILLRRIWEKLAQGNICVGDYLKIWYQAKPDLITYGAAQIKPVKTKLDPRAGVFIGRLSADTGLKEYLVALQFLKLKYNLKITFCGDGPLRKQAEKIGRVTGMVKDIEPYLKKAAFVLTSSYLSLIEALLLKKPVYVLAHNQLKIDCFRSHPALEYFYLSQSASELISQFKIKPAKNESGYQWAKKQTWLKLAKQYLSLWLSKVNFL